MPLLHLLRQNPVIAAVKDNASLQLAIDSECQFISVLYGNICTISNIVKKIKNAGKYAFIHFPFSWCHCLPQPRVVTSAHRRPRCIPE